MAIDMNTVRFHGLDTPRAGRGGRTPGRSLMPRAAAPEVEGPESGANLPGGVAQRQLAVAGARGMELGEPTSFRGGAGAPEPIGIIRGNTMTFSGGRPPGSQFALPEVASDIQARQSWNRAGANLATAAADQRGITDPRIAGQFGTYREAGQTGEEIRGAANLRAATATAKNPYYEALAKKTEAETGAILPAEKRAQSAQAVKDFQDALHASRYSNFDPKSGKMGFVPKDEGMARDVQRSERIAATQGTEAAMKHLDESQVIRQWLVGQALPPGTDVNAYIDARAGNPELWQGLVAKAREYVSQAPAPTIPQPWYRVGPPTAPAGQNFAPAISPETDVMGAAGAPRLTPEQEAAFRAEQAQKRTQQEQGMVGAAGTAP